MPGRRLTGLAERSGSSRLARSATAGGRPFAASKGIPGSGGLARRAPSGRAELTRRRLRAAVLRAVAGRTVSRVRREARRAAVSTSSSTLAAASGGRVSPDTSASTVWWALSDQFQSTKSPAVRAQTATTGLENTTQP